jgi:hypothetical protein
VGSDDATAQAAEAHAAEADAPARTHHSPVKRILGVIVSLVIIVGIFGFAIPKVADYGAVWAAMQTMTPLELASLFVAMVFNLFTYWWANMAALPGLRLWPAAVLTQTTTSVANTLPGGGAIAVGLTYAILKSWGFTGTDTALYVGVTGVWNIFAKLALPVLSIALLVLTGQSSAAYVTAAIVGVVVLAIAVGLLSAVFYSERLARSIGSGLGKVIAAVMKPFRRGKPAMSDMGDGAVRFRRDTIGLVEHRWIRLTFFTLLSQVALFFVLLLALRAQHREGLRRLLLQPAALGDPADPGWGRGDRPRLRGRPHVGSPRGRARGGGGGRADLPVADLRDPDPARGLHVPDLGEEQELAAGRT